MAQISDTRLHAMRVAYGRIRSIPQGSTAHARLVQMVTRLPREQREQLEASGIRWLAPIAFNVNRGEPMALLPGHEQHVRDNGRGFMKKIPVEG